MQANIYQKLCIVILSLLALALAGCGGGDSGNEITPIPINTPPSVSIIQPSNSPCPLNVKTNSSLDIVIQVDDPDGGKLTCAWTCNAGCMEPEESTVDAGDQVTTRFTPPNYNGSCTLEVIVNDGEDSAGASLVVQITGNDVDPEPQLRILSMNMTPDPATPSATANMSATVDNPGGKPLTYTWTSKHGRLTGTGSTVSWLSPNASGVYGIYLTVTDGTASARAGKAVMVAGPTGGLLGQYYTTNRNTGTVQFSNMVLSRIDPSVNFFWEKLSPAPGTVPGDGFGAKWTGFIKCAESGTYVFRVHVDDGVRMSIKDDSGQWVAVIPNNSENWNDHTEGAWLPETPIPLNLLGGKWYPVELDYFEGGGDAFIRLYWSINGGLESVIQQQYLKPPS